VKKPGGNVHNSQQIMRITDFYLPDHFKIMMIKANLIYPGERKYRNPANKQQQNVI